MLSLSKKTEYALIALGQMARAPDRTHSARQMAEQFGISPALLMNILKQLNRHEILVSVRGPKGGYKLARPSQEITLNEVIAILDGPAYITQCATMDDEQARHCRLAGICPVREPVRKVHRKLQKFLANVTIDEIAEELKNTAAQELQESKQ